MQSRAIFVRLIPQRPPGRANRKALAHVDEIHRLRADGYTCEAIREALAAVGVFISKSTVQRELARPASHEQRNEAATRSVVAPPPPAAAPRARALADDSRSGKDIAASFVNSRIANPLIRARSPA